MQIVSQQPFKDDEDSRDFRNSFSGQHDSIKLDFRLERALGMYQYISLFEVQKRVLSRAYSMQGFERDLCLVSPTGSGKTLAYVLPLLQILSRRISFSNSVLILVPSSELAVQVCAAADRICQAVDVKITMLQHFSDSQKRQPLSFALQRNGKSSRIEIPSSIFSRPAFVPEKPSQIVVSSPGILATFQSFLELNALRFSVVDETDRMLHQSYQNWTQILNPCDRKIEFNPCLGLIGQRVRRKLQFLLSSATLSINDIQRLQLFAPEQIGDQVRGQKSKLSHNISEFLVISEFSQKFDTLLRVLRSCAYKRFIVFCSSAARAENLFTALSKETELPCYKFSGRMSSGYRAFMLRTFQDSNAGILVASDAAARGLHSHGVSAVISYDCPKHYYTYLHRAGRTARAGAVGSSYVICTSSEAHSLELVCEYAIPVLDLARVPQLIKISGIARD